jgi:glucokinase
MLTFKEVVYQTTIGPIGTTFLVADIGGTNANFGIFQHVDGRHQFILSIHFKSQEIADFSEVVKQVLDYAQIQLNVAIKIACLAAAGVVSPERDHVKPTNLPFVIDTRDIKNKTGLHCVYLANDFEVIGFGLSLIAPNDLVQVNKGTELKGTNKAILGAGTGLGKCILFWEKDRQIYMPVASEGGHADFAPQTELEYELVSYLRTEYKITCSVSWEDLLSGNGIGRIYHFFKARNVKINGNEFLAKNGLHPDTIFNSRSLDEHAWNTFELYARIYARCAKNFALDSLSRGGIYIAGGIAAKNLDLFRQECFLNEFIECGKQQELLRHIPIYVITDYNVSLYGVAEYMRAEELCEL